MRKNYFAAILLWIALFLSPNLFAQCPQVFHAGDDIWMCYPGQPTQLNGHIDGDYLSFSWSPSLGLSNVFILNPEVNVTKTSTYVLSGWTSSGNTVVNGDFELGIKAFTSDYTYSPGSLLGNGQYDIVTSPRDDNPNFPNCPDHTSKSGLQMAITGSSDPKLMAWCQSIPVTPHSIYTLNFYTSWLTPGSSAMVEASINGQPQGPHPLGGSPVNGGGCKWEKSTFLWDSMDDTNADVCIRFVGLGVGEAIAMDDVTFKTTCIQGDTVTVNIIPDIKAITAPTSVIINTCKDFTTTLNGAGSTTGANIHYQWNTPDGHILSGANTLTPVVDASGEYTLTVSFDNGLVKCTNTATSYVLQNNTLSVSIPQPLVLNCTTTAVNLNGISNQPGASTYEWTTGPDGHIVSGADQSVAKVDKPGDYHLVVTNKTTGCTAEATVTVQKNTTPPVAIANAGILRCIEQQTTLSGIGSSTGPLFSYSWSTPNGNIVSGKDSLTAVANAAGTYIFQVSNSLNHCVSKDTVVVLDDFVLPNAEVEPAGTITCAVPSQTLSAANSSTGPNFAYNWTTTPGGNIVSGANTLSPVVNAPGMYYLVVTNTTSGCTAVDSVLVANDMTAITAIANAPQALTCVTGQVSLNANGSTVAPNLAYQWTTSNGHIVSGANTPTPVVDAAGTYQLLLSNPANGCSSTDLAEVTLNNTPPQVQVAALGTLSCAQPIVALNGTTNLAAADITYTWTASNGGHFSLGENTLMPCIDASGTYTLLVTGVANGCTAQANITISGDFAVPGASLAVGGNLNCNATSVDLTATSNAGTATLDHNWTLPGGGTTNTGINPVLGATAPGNYLLTVTNTQNGCSSTATASVVAHGPVQATLSSLQNVSCFGGANGALSATSTGGNGQFSYLWSNAGQTASINSLPAGTYILTVTDGENCTATVSATLTQPLELLANATATPPVAAGGSDGTATASPSGGTGAYTYAWSNMGTTATITGLTEGFYTVTVTDANGCTVVQTVKVGEGGCNLQAGFSSTNPTCNGLANGVATVLPNGGTAPFNYNWSSGGKQQTESGLHAGNYQVTVSDVNGCEFVGTVQLTEPLLLTLSANVVVNTTCFTAAEGSATVVAAGGTGTIDITWSNGQTGPTATGLAAGDYDATATDANGCSTVTTVTIQAIDTESPAIQASNINLPLGPSGSVTLTLPNLSASATDNCGIAGVNISPSSFDCSQLGNRNVTISAIDLSGNSTTTTITVNVIDNIAPGLSCPADIVRCAGESTVTYAAPVATDNCLGLGGQFDLVAGLPSGADFPPGSTTNTYSFTDASGNVGSCSFKVTILSPLQVGLDSVVADLNGQHIGGVQVHVAGSQPGYTYNWTLNGQTVATTEDLSGVGMGTYTLVVTDAAGCTAQAGPFVVPNVVATNDVDWIDRIGIFPNPTAGKVNVVLPDQLSNSDIQVSVADGTGRVVLRQDNSKQKQFSFDLSRLTDGLYSVMIRVNGQQGVWKVVKNQ